ncbi:vWA domain-containing protein [Actinokineospora inagensis]|uniref:vWA domain-containing protein n=1 Tax=Actinokineospora inagensis TaxID=103730 RepID=UPI000401E6AF|nr:VWA domain-containing protein [Actinokineospora inagensis]
MTFDFGIQVDQNEYLPMGGGSMDAIITVTLTGDTLGAPGVDRRMALVILLDTSGSMSGSKIVQARRAVNAVIDDLPDGVEFAVVAGTQTATMVYPNTVGLAESSRATRKQARYAVGGLMADGGTAIGSWLRLAADLFATTQAPIRHAVLLTDGRNEHEPVERFNDTVLSCEGKFTCDARAVGEDEWQAQTLEHIANTLHGSVRGLPDPEHLVADFTEITERLMGTAAVDVTMRLWTPAHATVRFLKQVFPRIVDITDRGRAHQPRLTDYPTGRWTAEARHFHLRVEFAPGEVGEGMIAAKVRMVSGEQESAERRVRAFWTEDLKLSTQVSAQVTHFTIQEHVVDLVNDGVAAHDAGDADAADDKFDRAITLTRERGNAEAAAHLDRLVEARTDPARVRDQASVLKQLAMIASKRTVRLRPEEKSLMPTCPRGHESTNPDECDKCGWPIGS